MRAVSSGADTQVFTRIDQELCECLQIALGAGSYIPLDQAPDCDLGLMASEDVVPVLRIDQNGQKLIILERERCGRLFALVDSLRAGFISSMSDASQVPAFLRISPRSTPSKGVSMTLLQPWPGVPVLFYQYALADDIQDAVTFHHDRDTTVHGDMISGSHEKTGWSCVNDIGVDVTHVICSLGLRLQGDSIEIRFIGTADVQDATHR